MRSFDCSSNPNIDMDQEELEEKIDKFENSSREILMKLFMFSCKSSKEQRAYEVATIMDSNALQLAIKYATKTRALVLAQNLNILAEKKAVIEYEKERKRQEEEERENRSHFGSRQMHSNDYVTNEIQQDTSIKLSSTNHDQIGDDIIFESENQSTMKSSNTQLTSNCTLDDSLKSCLTPTNIPLTTTRLNPFKANGSAIKTPLNDASKSIINELEEKINKQSASKEKDQWKPTPTRKLTKSKVSNTPTGSISSFLTKN
jgi:chromosome transmission fidelity protein 4